MNMRRVLVAGAVLLAYVLQGCVAAGPEGASPRPAQDRSANEALRQDQKIEATAIDRIYEQFRVYIHVNVTSFKRNVLISGEVPDEATRSAIEKIVSGIDGVRNVNNELAISPSSSLISRSNDSRITSAVRLRLARDKRIRLDDIKVVTENGTVFLMGNVKRAEADAAADVASTTSGVKLVVKLFEYTD